MLRRAGRSGGLGWVAALAAAYALVFQLVFVSALVAAMPRDATGAPLCAGAGSLAVGADLDGKGERTDVHCPACLARVDVADLPPPIPVPAPERQSTAAIHAEPARVLVLRPPPRRPSQPRAPPFLG